MKNEFMNKLSEFIYVNITDRYDVCRVLERQRAENGIKALRTHLGSAIFITATDKDKKNKHIVSEDKLRDGEVSAVTYSVGNYAIRESVMLYKDDDDNYYTSRVPADKEQIENFKKQHNERSIIFIDVDGCRPVREIRAANMNDAEPKWRFVCLATSAKSLVWSESIDFIGTVKKNVFVPDKKSDLFVLVNYMGDSFSTETWHRFTHKGEAKEYKVHPYDIGSDERRWEW